MDGSKGDASDGTLDGDSVKMGACKGFGTGADGVEGECGAAAGMYGRPGKVDGCIGGTFATCMVAAVGISPCGQRKAWLSGIDC